jgi:hypothetical protein
MPGQLWYFSRLVPRVNMADWSKYVSSEPYKAEYVLCVWLER